MIIKGKQMSRARDLPRLVSTWDTGSAFRAQVGEAEGVRTFFHPARDASELPAAAVPGAIVAVALRFLDRDTEFRVHGRVLERHTSGPSIGLRLAFLPEERDRQELVLAAAEGESVPYLRRKAVRTPCNLDVQVSLEDGSTLRAKLTTISERGAYLELASLTSGQKVELSIVFPGQRERVRVGGRITAAVAGLERGSGIEFIFVAAKQRDAVAAAVAQFRAGLPRG